MIRLPAPFSPSSSLFFVLCSRCQIINGRVTVVEGKSPGLACCCEYNENDDYEGGLADRLNVLWLNAFLVRFLILCVYMYTFMHS